MSDDLYEVWRDDRLIEAAARGDLLELEDDPAAGPLVALAVLADGGPLPSLDVDGAALVDSRNSRRYAVRSLAVAVTAVATLSTSGVAAVVTGDPLRPAKAVWHQIQDHTGFRSESADAESGSALGPATTSPDADASRPAEVSVAPRTAPSDGLVARASAGAPEQGTGDPATTPEDAQSAAGDDQASTQPYAEDDTQSSDEQDQSEDPAETTEPTGPDDQEPGDDTGSQPAPGEDQPAPDDQSDDDGLDGLVPGTPGDIQGDGTTQPLPAQGAPSQDGYADDEQVLGQPSPQPLSGTSEDTAQDTAQEIGQNAVQGTLDGAYGGGSTDGSTDTDTTTPPPTLTP